MAFARILPIAVLALAAFRLPAGATSCPPPQIDPAKGFVANFNNPCYALPLASSNGPGESGDANALYDQVYYQVVPGYQLVILGTFPNARFLSATIYDDHLAVTSSMIDAAILPLSPGMINPLLPGAAFRPHQMYGITVSFGGGPPRSVSPGCSTAGTTIGQNELDAGQIHPGLTWLGYPGLPAGFPTHETGPNAAGIVMLRKYADIDAPAVPEVVIVRSLSDGCAITAQQAIDAHIVSESQTLSSPWLHQGQITAHQQFAQIIQPSWCFPQDPQNALRWLRATDYIPLDDNYAGYLNAPFTPAEIGNLLSGGIYLRVRFLAPTTPNTPCTTGNCRLTGNEQTRYFSLSFQAPAQNVAGPSTLYSIDDRSLVRDPNGYVTLVVGFGAPRPPNVTSANYYTWLDLSGVANYNTIIGVRLRDMLPNLSFECSTFNVPYQTTEYNPLGGYMGAYVPTVDFPTAAVLPDIPTPVVRPSSCYLEPQQTPFVCQYSNAARPQR